MQTNKKIIWWDECRLVCINCAATINEAYIKIIQPNFPIDVFVFILFIWMLLFENI